MDDAETELKAKREEKEELEELSVELELADDDDGAIMCVRPAERHCIVPEA